MKHIIKNFFKKERLLYKYRFVIQNEDTFEDRFSMRLSRMNMLIILGFFATLLITITIISIAFTPLKEYIPGYTPIKDKIEIQSLLVKLDSITRKVNINDNYIYNFRNIITGEISDDEENFKYNNEEIVSNHKKEELIASQDEINFRSLVEEKTKYNIFEYDREVKDIISFFAPMKGIISAPYNESNNHKAIDILCKKNTPVKATLRGIVLFSEWSIQTGYVIILLHSDDIVSVYKHNYKLIKKQGDIVEKGEVIAFSGNEGKISTGHHLHFELWINSIPVDPKEYIDFN